MITKQEILKVAESARISLTPREAEKIIPQIKEVLQHFKLLSKADVSNVRSTIHPLNIENIFREDKIQKCLKVEDALKNCKNKKNNYILGPKTK